MLTVEQAGYNSFIVPFATIKKINKPFCMVTASPSVHLAADGNLIV